jgi:GxxExxY protein
MDFITRKRVTQLSYDITGCAIKVHKALGPGLLESVYEYCLKYELEKQGFEVEQQVIVPVHYDGMVMDTNLRLDLLVEDTVVVELKSVQQMIPIYDAQILTYMKLLRCPLGLLMNFFTDNITRSTKSFVNEHFRRMPEY